MSEVQAVITDVHARYNRFIPIAITIAVVLVSLAAGGSVVEAGGGSSSTPCSC